RERERGQKASVLLPRQRDDPPVSEELQRPEHAQLRSHGADSRRIAAPIPALYRLPARSSDMPYAFVNDVAASWEHYQRFERAFEGAIPDGLVLHAAGPTDEGFRIIAVWESEDAWER